MYSSYSLSKNLVCVPILAIQLFLLTSSFLSLNLTNEYLNHKCIATQGKYQTGSEHEKNLNFLIGRVSSSKIIEGFRQLGHGQAPNSVTVLIQCRGDSYANCHSCFATAVSGLRKRCQGYKGAIIWYDQCYLVVTSIEPSAVKIDQENTFSMHNPNNVTGDIKSFNKQTRDFLYELTIKADKPTGKGNTLLFYAAGTKKIGTKNLYAMVQCSQSILICKDCLKWTINELPKCCDGKQGARFYSTSCNLRYELYPFLRT